jgi:glutamate N-acetyltransferase/amino-acid N-acetyltransferase
VRGFKAAAVASGLKKMQAFDMALIVSEKRLRRPVFLPPTRSKPPRASESKAYQRRQGLCHHRQRGMRQCLYGDPGFADAVHTAELVGKALGISPESVLVASTGVIGQRLDMEKVSKAIPNPERRPDNPRASQGPPKPS